MSRFDAALEFTLEHEGGFADHPSDPGGATNFGISTRFLRSIGDERDAKDLKKLDASFLYLEHFWRDFYDDLPSEEISTKVFDAGVNMGPTQAAKLLQQALNAVGCDIDVDGKVGPMTRAAFESADGAQLAAAYRSEMAGFYRMLAQADVSRRVFLAGWLRRAYS